MSGILLPLAAFTLSVLLLFLVQRWITQHVQGVGLLLFDSFDAAMAILWLLLLPGIVVHELSHWLMARLLGLKTGKLRLWPQLKGKQIILGSVEVQRSSPLADSLVGLAPFLGGTLVILLLGFLAFDARALGQAWTDGAWERFLEGLRSMSQVPDSLLWLYLLVAVSNAMMPSPTDTVSWRPVLLYTALVTIPFLLVVGIPNLPPDTASFAAAGFRTLTYAFGLALLLDVAFAILIGLTELAVGTLRGTRVVYK